MANAPYSIQDSFSEKPIYQKLGRAIRIIIVGAAVLLTVGGSMASSTPHTAKWLSLAGYILFAIVLGLLIAMELFFVTKGASLIPSSQKVRQRMLNRRGC